MRFPENPVDEQVYEYKGRLFQWVDSPGMWKSIGASRKTDDITVIQNPLWKDIVDKPTGIALLGNQNEVEGDDTEIRHRRGNGIPDADEVEIGSFYIDLLTGDVYTKLPTGAVVMIGSTSSDGDQINENAQDIININIEINELEDKLDNHTHRLDDLSDVGAQNPDVDNFLIYNGSEWVAEPFTLDSKLSYQGAINATEPEPPRVVDGALYINDTDGVVHSSFTGIAGATVNVGNVLGWSDTNSRWYLLGDISSSSITDIVAGLAIAVDSSEPAKPIVAVDKLVTDEWYASKQEFDDLTESWEDEQTVLIQRFLPNEPSEGDLWYCTGNGRGLYSFNGSVWFSMGA